MAIMKAPQNPNCLGLASDGLSNAIQVDPRCPAGVVTWIVNDANKFQSGSGFSVQQLLGASEDYSASWQSKKVDMGWKNSNFGKGPYSHDALCWTHLQDTFRDDLRFSCYQHFEKCNSIIYQLKKLHEYDELKALLKARFDHKNKNLKLSSWVCNAWQCQHSLSQQIETNFRASLVLCLITFTMPLKAAHQVSGLNSQFCWSSDTSHNDIIEFCSVMVKFVPQPCEVDRGHEAVVDKKKKKCGKKAATGKKGKHGDNDGPSTSDVAVDGPPVGQQVFHEITYPEAIGRIMDESIGTLVRFGEALTPEAPLCRA